MTTHELAIATLHLENGEHIGLLPDLVAEAGQLDVLVLQQSREWDWCSTAAESCGRRSVVRPWAAGGARQTSGVIGVEDAVSGCPGGWRMAAFGQRRRTWPVRAR
jgi:hypothetical protein